MTKHWRHRGLFLRPRRCTTVPAMLWWRCPGRSVRVSR